jgi:hypothetical protein
VCCSSTVCHLGAFPERRDVVASDNSQNRLAVAGHVQIILVKRLGVGCLKEHLSPLFVRVAYGWVDAREPRSHRRVVSDKLDTDIPGAQIALRMREQVTGVVLDDKVGVVIGGWLSNGDHAQKSGHDGGLEEHDVLGSNRV